MEGPFHDSERAALLVDSSGANQQGSRFGGTSAGRLSTSSSFFSVERLRSLYPVAIFCATSALLFADQNLMAPNLTDIAKTFDFDDNERYVYSVEMQGSLRSPSIPIHPHPSLSIPTKALL